MIERTENLSIKEDREYLTAENEACDILRSSGYIASGNPSDNFKTIDVFKPIHPLHNEYIGKYKNFQEAKELLID